MEATYRINSLGSLYQVLRLSAGMFPDRPAVCDDVSACSYAELLRDVESLAAGLAAHGVGRSDRVALLVPKDPSMVQLILACNALGAVFVPISPQLKQPQIAHILADCQPILLVTTAHRAEGLRSDCLPSRTALITTDALPRGRCDSATAVAWGRRAVDGDPATILYTSGSTGLAKGVVLSQRNLVSGALSVADYLELTARDVVLGVLPASFDAGLSQITTALAAGACYVPHEFLTPAQFRKAVLRHAPSVLTAVPSLWYLIAEAGWEPGQADSLRLIANTGGHLNRNLLVRLQGIFGKAKPVLMYGLTESFRSTWLDPAELDQRPGSMGRAVPNAEILVVRADGSECDPGEPGELVHRGSFVTLGYLGLPERDQQRFKPWPKPLDGLARQEIAVWSGDTVRRDADGFLYFVGRNDEMIKVLGHRISPNEVETALLACDGVGEAAVFGVDDERLGQAIVACVVTDAALELDDEELLRLARRRLPGHMLPTHIVRRQVLPRNANGKIDRPALKQQWLAARQGEACSDPIARALPDEAAR